MLTIEIDTLDGDFTLEVILCQSLSHLGIYLSSTDSYSAAIYFPQSL